MSDSQASTLYRDYWKDEAAIRDKRAYYERLYARIRAKIQIDPAWRVLDIAGGNGQFLRYLGIQNADVLDISQSGLDAARSFGFHSICGDIEKRFPVPEESYEAALCFEVLEHLHYPAKTLSEIHNVLKPGGVLYLGQPNMRADGVHHVRRYHLEPLLDDLKKSGFSIEWVDYVPAYSMRDSIVSDIRKNPSLIRKAVQCVNLCLSFLPRGVRDAMARAVPDRFALIFVVKALKNSR
ncbi:MAG: class I SAM-dependent methyltransferase [Candidatus Omnitrophica bacterium]|nr:class I SAM-dependent methyltransferase [Candidatus Omnitrophota bacterium]